MYNFKFPFRKILAEKFSASLSFMQQSSVDRLLGIISQKQQVKMWNARSNVDSYAMVSVSTMKLGYFVIVATSRKPQFDLFQQPLPFRLFHLFRP
jgi:hypothetical protein